MFTTSRSCGLETHFSKVLARALIVRISAGNLLKGTSPDHFAARMYGSSFEKALGMNLKSSQKQQIETLCRRFRELCEHDEPPEIEPVLTEVDDEARPLLATQLLRIDVEHRRNRGADPSPDEYRRRYPQYAAHVNAAFGDDPIIDALEDTEYASKPHASDDSTCEYQIVSQVAASHSGLLYHAIRDSDGSEVDIFVVSDHDDEETRRVRKRVALAAQMIHPGAARVTDVRREVSDESYMLEPVAERNLMQVVSGSSETDPKVLLSYGLQIASVVADGHRLGLDHGDVSPNSIRIRANGSVQLDYVRTTLGTRDRDGSAESARFRAPEVTSPDEADSAADTFSLAAVLIWFIPGLELDHAYSAAELQKHLANWLSEFQVPADMLESVSEALQDALRSDPADRISAQQLLVHFEELADRVGVDYSEAKTKIQSRSIADKTPVQGDLEMTWDSSRSPAPATRDVTHFGRFRVIDKIGEGGMGEVFRAEDPMDRSIVAVKVLSSRFVLDQNAVRRFRKEARLLGQIKSPYVTNLFEVNEDGGHHFLAMEFVSGTDLKKMIGLAAPLEERVALSIIADTARGLVSAHEQGIIHRDVKPANILLAHDPVEVRRQGLDHGQSLHEFVDTPLTIDSLRQFRVKLSDFGLARQLDQSESMNLTQSSGFIGTPLYMSPEQFSNKAKFSPATDVYALGVTLYQMLAGKVPFKSSDLARLINKHCRQSPKPLTTLNPDVSEAAWEIVQRALAKEPQDRYADASQFLRDVEYLLRGETTNITVHPQVPSYRPGEVFEEVFQWQLKGSAGELWPNVSNTERINRAVGVPSVVYDTRRDEHGRLRKYGEFNMAGMHIGWEEHPFEWVEGQRLGILREFNQGPFG